MELGGHVFLLCLVAVALQDSTRCTADPVPTEVTSAGAEYDQYTTEQETTTSTEIPFSVAALSLDGDDNEATDSSTDTSTVKPTPEFFFIDRYTGRPCILARLNMTFVINYPTQDRGQQEITVQLPQDAKMEGDCGRGEDSSLTLVWGSFRFTMNFRKSPVGDAWYVDVLNLRFLPTTDVFGPGASVAGAQELWSGDSLTLFLTPAGKSFRCSALKEVDLLDQAENQRGSIRFQGVLIQPFAILTSGDYGPDYPCLEDAGSRRLRDETVPVAVGSTLAVVVLATVTGYGILRYLKVKKIEYDTME